MAKLVRGLSLLLLLICSVSTQWVSGSVPKVSAERIRLIKEIQERLNVSFQCEFSISIGDTRKYAMANSGGIIIVDRSFLQNADRGRIFFAIAHEYAHAYLEHDVRLFAMALDQDAAPTKSAVEARRRFEKEADGIAARKAKEMGFSIESILDFILSQPDPEKGIPFEYRVYSKPRERADYILTVYHSS